MLAVVGRGKAQKLVASEWRTTDDAAREPTASDGVAHGG